MRNTKAKIAIIALMLLTFLGQAFASATLSCTHQMNMESSLMTDDNMSDMVRDIRMMVENSAQDSSQSTLMDCCQEECKCPMSSCVSVSLFFDYIRFNAETIAEQKISQLPLIHQSQINTSLYRPPIS